MFFPLIGAIGCESHHHDYDDHHDVVVVRDENGWEHHGWYDTHGDWHGTYYDERHVAHDDPVDWGRNHDREYEHRGDWDHDHH
jgi:hypothetical protein